MAIIDYFWRSVKLGGRFQNRTLSIGSSMYGPLKISLRASRLLTFDGVPSSIRYIADTLSLRPLIQSAHDGCVTSQAGAQPVRLT